MKHFFYFFSLLLLSLLLETQNVVCNFNNSIEFSHYSDDEVFLSLPIVFCNSGDERSWADQCSADQGSEQGELTNSSQVFCGKNLCSADQQSEEENLISYTQVFCGENLCSADRASEEEELINSSQGFCDSNGNQYLADQVSECVQGEQLIEYQDLPIPTDGNAMSFRNTRGGIIVGSSSLRTGQISGIMPQSSSDYSGEGSGTGGGSGGGEEDGHDTSTSRPFRRFRRIDVFWIHDNVRYQLDSVFVDSFLFYYGRAQFEESLRMRVGLGDNTELLLHLVRDLRGIPEEERYRPLSLRNRNILFQYYRRPEVAGERVLLDPDSMLCFPGFLREVDYIVMQDA